MTSERVLFTIPYPLLTAHFPMRLRLIGQDAARDFNPVIRRGPAKHVDDRPRCPGT